jgi:tetratricopeptide (TPR) repeat protein
MKLIGLTGMFAGREFPVTESGLTVGRGNDNSIVLDGDRQASRYHARFEHVDGAWLVHDRESVNGVFVNGKRIHGSSPLAENDEVRVGQSVFRVGLAAEAAPAPGKSAEPPLVVFKPTAPAEPEPAPVTFTPLPLESHLPLGATPPPPPPDAATLAKRKRMKLLAAALGGVAVAVILGALLLSPTGDKKKPAGMPTGGGVQQPAAAEEYKALRAVYESLRAGPNNLFRYELSLHDGILSLTIDDPLNNRSVEDSRRLTPAQVKLVGDALLTDKVLQLASPPQEGAAGELARTRLLVLCGGRGNQILVENTREPAVLHEAGLTLVNFAQELFGIGAEPMPLEEAVAKAEESYLNARRYYEERNVDPPNLYRAVKEYRLVLARLKNYETKPDWYAKAQAESDTAQKLLESELTKRKLDAQTLKSAGRPDEARQILAQILEMVKDYEENDIARWAHDEAVKLDFESYRHQKKH